MNLNIFHIDEDVRRIKVPQVFDRTEKEADEDVTTIKEWIKSQHHFPETLEDAQIRNFLVLNKFSIEKTKQKIHKYYTIRSVIPEFFCNANPKYQAMKRLMDSMYCCVHPKAKEGMYRIIFLKVKPQGQFAPLEMMFQIFNIYEMRLLEDCMVGDIFIVDLINITFNDLTQLTPTLLHKVVTIYEKVYSFRLKSFHYINSPSYISTLMTILKSLMKAKLFDRFHVHEDSEVVNEILNKDELSEDYGGKGPSLQKLNDLVPSEEFAFWQPAMNLNIFHIDENVRKSVYQMFGRTENEAKEDVRTIRDWIKSQPHLPEIMEDVKIENFLIENKFRVEKTKRKIDKYYTIRNLMPDFLEDSNPKSPKMKRLMQEMYCCVYPEAIEGMYRLFFLKIKENQHALMQEATLQTFNIAEMRLFEDCMIGEIFVLDLEHLTLGDVKIFTPSLVAKIFALYDIFSVRLKTMYFLNSPYYVSVVVSIFKSVLKPKIFERIQVHPDAEVLKQVFTKDKLPKDYGGDGPSLQDLNDLMEKKLAQYQDRFDKCDKLRVDESLRPEKLYNDEMLGFYGNFKKLDVD